jgi:hypothetical protein
MFRPVNANTLLKKSVAFSSKPEKKKSVESNATPSKQQKKNADALPKEKRVDDKKRQPNRNVS